ncbi:nuclease [Devosia geojensis]|uniref:Nuclease n=1 Tax=Devosia geojensis TaxID=443610 RepID=A0A0F5FFF2_9HYPH|nr:endonuclease/exonuclease/phosphatase family protein [Devosia geojensis]KKB06932.1 nuclease [Devosia geojensis]
MARTTVSFATCNLYNLNMPGLPMYGAAGWSEDQYEAKITWLGGALKRMQSDVYGFQELWHAEALEAVIAEAGLENTHTVLAPSGHAGQSIVCAAAVRAEMLVGEPEWIVEFPPDFVLQSQGDDPQTPEIAVAIDSFSRPVLHFEIETRPSHPHIHVYVCHLKSKRPTEIHDEDWYVRNIHQRHAPGLGAAISTIRRTAEAAALRMILVERLRGTDDPVVVLGDVNDGILSNTINILSGQPNYLLGLSTGGTDAGLYSGQTLQQYRSTRDVYYTHIFQNERESLDHILVSQEFYDNSRKRIWAFDGLEILTDHLNFEDHKASGTTDHGIVRATFQYRPARVEED